MIASMGPTGSPSTARPSIDSMPERSAAVEATMDAVSSRKPSTPSAVTIAQAAASGAADREPSSVGFTTG